MQVTLDVRSYAITQKATRMNLDLPRVDALTQTPSSADDSLVSSRSWSRLDLLLSAAVALAVATLGWFFRTEITPTDPWHYVMAALEFPQDSWVPLGYTRYGMILPLAPFVLAWGYAPATFIVPALVATFLMTACTYLIATRWWGRIAGFIAVALLVSNWIVFVNLSRYYPDIPSIALVLLAVVVAIVVRDRQRSGCGPSNWLILLVGFLLGGASKRARPLYSRGPSCCSCFGCQGEPLRTLR